ncbi:hypothetical protein Fleli_1658 [Bernardetia litoralis DSM 6794]|uniref:Uncharacterized protein n=1 Tax=Bernardetia litoralis (strain ATCC 23117 / DSM 6794 / NBRC 15988 / NCIMB 1366 / Fx l1 / Sio-4) TaxID=880071 RepID=I4AJD3_BERLS|nr:hypothetical protein [Bernardetia litoralis]AFM04068.1 hypothetical protein Fleli_1658 [Bernardetia litoralis DSM 6794]
MRNFILFSFFIILISLLTISKAHSLNSFFEFSSEESSKKINTVKKSSFETHSNSYSNSKEEKPKSIEPTKQKTAKEQRKIAKQERKEFRKAIWKSIKEQRKINKQIKKKNRKNGIKKSSKKTHWAAYLSFFSTLTALGIIALAIILKYAIFNVLVPLAIILLIVSVIASIIGISAVSSKEITLYHKSHTITLALIGGIIAFLSLLFIGFIIIALSALSI